MKLYNGDCLEIMKQLPDKSIDMILCDLPYGTTMNKWDIPLDLNKLWKQYKRIIKDNGAICLFSQLPFTQILGCSNLSWLRYEWIFEKGNATGFLNANKMPLKAHENILVFYKKLPTYNPQFTEGKPYTRTGHKYSSNYGRNIPTPTINKSGKRYPRDVLYFKNPHNNLKHPTAKPLYICEYMIKTYTNEGETVLDNCMGSGTTGIACKNLNRNFIGIEIDEKYFNLAKQRIEGKK